MANVSFNGLQADLILGFATPEVAALAAPWQAEEALRASQKGVEKALELAGFRPAERDAAHWAACVCQGARLGLGRRGTHLAPFGVDRMKGALEALATGDEVPSVRGRHGNTHHGGCIRIWEKLALS